MQLLLSLVSHNTQYKYFMSSRSKEIHPEQRQMLTICWEDKSNKAVMQLISYISSIVRVPHGPKQIETNLITVYVSQPAGKIKASSVTTGQLLMNCLIYCLFKYKNLKVDFYSATMEISKSKKKKSLVIEIGSDFSFNITQSFINNIMKYLEQQEKSSFGISAFNIKQIDIKCNNTSISSNDVNIKRYILSFIQYFYINIHFLSSNNNFYIAKNNLEIFSDDNLAQRRQIQIGSQSESNNKVEQNQQKILREKIYKQLGVFYIDILIIKSNDCDIRQIISAQSQVKENNIKNSIQQKEQNGVKQVDLGYFGRFYGNSLEYLSKLHLTFSQEFNIEDIAVILRALPNLNSMRLRKSGDQVILPNIDHIIQVLIEQNELIQHFWLKNIKVQTITLETLEKLYVECPYLIELEFNLPTQQDHQKKILINAFRLRKISLSNNIQMSKLLINRRYNFNEIIQIIDCIEPICF